MRIYAIADALAPVGLTPPTLTALIADAENYSALLLQPQGSIAATDVGIRCQDRGAATAQFGQFLQDAAASQPDIVVTPEYSVPWEVLQNAISGVNAGPAEGKLWALGCESIRYSELQQWKLALANVAEVVFEPMRADDSKFVDPLAYVFRAPVAQFGGGAKLVVLVQFKTHPMVDPHDFERNHLQTGQRVYRFGVPGAGISLVTLICSDLLAVDDQKARDIHDRALILHIQLNGKRQHPSLLDFRRRLLGLSGDYPEVLTLNWARGTRVLVDGEDAQLGKCAGSAWYVKPERIDLDDVVVASNHRKGLYYTRLESRRTHALFLNFSPAAFRFTSSKVVRIGVPGPAAARRGPQLDTVKVWNAGEGGWMVSTPLDDGFSAINNECGAAAAQIRAVYEVCPLACERLIALCGGSGITRSDWHNIVRLKSFALTEDELVHRVTFCQPTHATSVTSRRELLRRSSHLWNALIDAANLPAVLHDASHTFELKWTNDKPHQNLKGENGEGATVIYLGESTQREAENVHNAVRNLLHQTMSDDEDGHEHDPHSTFRAKQRVAVWYTDNFGQRQLYVKTPRIADAQEDPADIRRAS